MNEEYTGVSEILLRKNEYVKNYQILQRRQLVFEDFLQYLLVTYGCYRPFCNLAQNQQPDEKPSVFRSFRVVLQSMIRQFIEVSQFQMNQIVKLKNIRNDMLKNAFDSVINQLQTFDTQQKMYKADLRKIVDRAEKIRRDAVLAKEQKNDIANYYAEDYLYNRYEALSREFEEVGQMSKYCQKKVEQLLVLRTNFLSEISKFRAALSTCRYFILDKFKVMCSEAKSGLATLFVVLFQNTRRGKAIFKRDLSQNQWNYLRGSRMRYEKSLADIEKNRGQSQQHNRNSENLIGQISRVTGQYNRRLNDLIKFIGQFIQALADVSVGFRAMDDKFRKSIFQSVGNIFEMAQSPLPWLRPVFQAFEACTSKFTQIGGRLRQSQNDLIVLSQKLKKHIQISISLLQSPNINFGSGEQRGKQIAYHTAQLQKQINSSELQNILRRILDVIEQQLAEIVQWMESVCPRKKKRLMDNSMDLSMVSEFEEVTLLRETSKDELWLWGEWRDGSYRLSSLESTRTALDAIKTPPPPADTANELQSYPCTLTNKMMIKGTLSVRDKDLKFISNQLTLKIPYPDIDSVTVKSKLFVQFLHLNTDKGELVFSGVSGVDKCKAKIEEQKTGGGGGGEAVAAAPAQKRLKVVLQTAQITAIKAREEKIRGELVDKATLTSLIPPVNFKDIGIDDFYSALYSDEPKVIKGKKWDCTSVYCLVQTGNHKVKATPYNAAGPKFYSLKDGVTFDNCPIFSERLIEYDHDLPKLPIPFMPKFVHCKQTQRIYWVSHEQINYYMENRSSGAPYATSLFVKLLHIIKKKGSDVEVEYYGAVQFVQDTAMKNVLKDKAEVEMKENLAKNLKCYHQRVEAAKSGGGDQPAPAGGDAAMANGAAEGEEDNKNSQQQELQKFKNQRNMLLIASAVLLISVLFQIIF